MDQPRSLNLQIAILIPAYKPGEQMLDLVRSLADAEASKIVLVNDGSPAEFREIFAQAQSCAGVNVLVHAENQGKGAALKTGLRYLAGLSGGYGGVVTADADGQHSVEDILKIAQQTLEHPEALILGGRRFDRDVPWKSMAGNSITRWVMRTFFGIHIYDTQTGLRGIPQKLIPLFLEIPYNRYEFEMEMLLVCQRKAIPMREVEIRTIYFEQNRGSHFHPFKDAVRVYAQIMRSAFSKEKKV